MNSTNTNNTSGLLAFEDASKDTASPSAPPSPTLSPSKDNVDHVESESEVEEEDDNYRKEHQIARCCECKTVKQFTTNRKYDLLCDACKHDMCHICTEYDEDNHSILSDEGEEDAEGQEQFRIHDDEADEAIAQVEDKTLPISSIMEKGFNEINFFREAFDSPHLKTRAQSLALELKYKISFEALKPEERTIRAVWTHSENSWTYRCHTPANLMPFIIKAFQGNLRTRALRSHFEKAPHLGLDAYPWFRYDSDTLYFEYRRCGSRSFDAQEYVDAMKAAARHLNAHVTAGNPVIGRLELTWCQRQDGPSEILGFFRRINGIETITLRAHDHYTDAYEDYQTNSSNRLQYDPSDMQKMVNRGELRGYPFVVKLMDVDGDEMVFGAKPLPGRGEDYDSDGDNSDEEEDGSENGSEAASEDGVSEDEDLED
ncbi:hypothetical protein BKA61DRAFT_686749 [Leptodontidium sp. MPI-SDFR-AT-0119]|nr:hypothetical protein BKA61DRAFT_686749 [Leptodontidium sp. MPI-SDFR-AT-0119]